MRVKDVMTTDVKSIKPNASVQEAAALMKTFNIGDLLISENEKAIGILTDRDIVLRLVAENISPECKIRDFMSQSPVTAAPGIDIHHAASIMSEHQVRRLPVVQDSELVGIVTLGDLAAEANIEADEVLQHVSRPTRKEVKHKHN